MKTSLVLVALTVLALCGVVWSMTAYWPDPSYESGYAAAFVPASGQWVTQMPPAHVCEEMAAAGIKQHSGLVYDKIVDGCRHGYYDAVNQTRGRLGWPPTTEHP